MMVKKPKIENTNEQDMASVLLPIQNIVEENSSLEDLLPTDSEKLEKLQKIFYELNSISQLFIRRYEKKKKKNEKKIEEKIKKIEEQQRIIKIKRERKKIEINEKSLLNVKKRNLMKKNKELEDKLALLNVKNQSLMLYSNVNLHDVSDYNENQVLMKKNILEQMVEVNNIQLEVITLKKEYDDLNDILFQEKENIKRGISCFELDMKLQCEEYFDDKEEMVCEIIENKMKKLFLEEKNEKIKEVFMLGTKMTHFYGYLLFGFFVKNPSFYVIFENIKVPIVDLKSILSMNFNFDRDFIKKDNEMNGHTVDFHIYIGYYLDIISKLGLDFEICELLSNLKLKKTYEILSPMLSLSLKSLKILKKVSFIKKLFDETENLRIKFIELDKKKKELWDMFGDIDVYNDLQINNLLYEHQVLSPCMYYL